MKSKLGIWSVELTDSNIMTNDILNKVVSKNNIDVDKIISIILHNGKLTIFYKY